MNKTEIIEKIKKCLALSKSTNQHEADVALRQAMALMAKHQIDPDDPDLLGITESHVKGSGIHKPTAYETSLANAIATLMNCAVIGTWVKEYTSRGPKLVRHWNFIGFDPYPEIASYAFDVLFRQLKAARAQYIKTRLQRVKIRENKVKRADMFCSGWVSEATKVALNIKPDVEKMAQIGTYKDNKYNLVKTKTTDRSANSTFGARAINDYASGRSAGKNAQINRAMNPGTNDTPQLGFNL